MKLKNPNTLEETALLAVYRNLVQEITECNSIEQILSSINLPPLVRKRILQLHEAVIEQNDNFKCLVPGIQFENHVFLEDGTLNLRRMLQEHLRKKNINHQIHSFMCLAIGDDEAFRASNPVCRIKTVELEECLHSHIVPVICIHKLLYATPERVDTEDEAAYLLVIYQSICICMDNGWINGAIMLIHLIDQNRHKFNLPTILEAPLVVTFIIYWRYQDNPVAMDFCAEVISTFWKGDLLAFCRALKNNGRKFKQTSHRIQVKPDSKKSRLSFS
ncbi:hypothetical protein L596_017080 [Steinernema carpocapsae]|uniref:Uncharacterized protein n=1 Tax=Steinernema carpocapsae TaxID=34508 RepID=A0A4U5N0X8_STECR|nr:hypothetical protein L596_017080 [Steinernema carpocapsae]